VEARRGWRTVERLMERSMDDKKERRA
jgi:hypothetical protein